jgi:hypothetical protein
MKTKCQYCKHEWEARVPQPMECPKCKRYLPVKEVEKIEPIEGNLAEIVQIAKENEQIQQGEIKEDFI